MDFEQPEYDDRKATLKAEKAIRQVQNEELYKKMKKELKEMIKKQFSTKIIPRKIIENLADKRSVLRQNVIDICLLLHEEYPINTFTKEKETFAHAFLKHKWVNDLYKILIKKNALKNKFE